MREIDSSSILDWEFSLHKCINFLNILPTEKPMMMNFLYFCTTYIKNVINLILHALQKQVHI